MSIGSSEELHRLNHKRTFGDETELTIAVNLGGVPEPQAVQDEEHDATDESSPLHERVINFVSSFQQPESKIIGHDWGAYEIANQAFDAMQSTIARQKIAAYPPDHESK